MVRIKALSGQKAALGALQFNDVPFPWKESRIFLIRMCTLPSQEGSYFLVLLRGQWKWRVSKQVCWMGQVRVLLEAPELLCAGKSAPSAANKRQRERRR